MRILAIAILLIVQSNLNAQDKKPDKAQTIEWLKTNLPVKITQRADRQTNTIYHNGYLITKQFQIFKDSIFISYTDTMHFAWIDKNRDLTWKTDYFYSFAIRDIERIGLYRKDEIGYLNLGDYDKVDNNSIFPYYLLFKTVNNKPLVYYRENGKAAEQTTYALIPFGNSAKSEGDALLNSYKETQLYKAFEHLRKLCGAPDPISF